MKAKHNKKRNTAFVYEALIKEATVAVLKNNNERSKRAIDIIREHFNSDSLLTRDLECYRSLYENQSLEIKISEKILKEATISKRMINPDELFAQQTDIINVVNKTLSPSVFNNFVPNYKSLAITNKLGATGLWGLYLLSIIIILTIVVTEIRKVILKISYSATVT